MIDWRHHSADPKQFLFKNFEKYQGPALYAWNNSIFQDRDFESLCDIRNSSKKDNAHKVGKFGLGFLSVFHLTGEFTVTIMLVLNN